MSSENEEWEEVDGAGNFTGSYMHASVRNMGMATCVDTIYIYIIIYIYLLLLL